MTTVSAGAEIFWESHGDGPPLFLLHGNGEDSSSFSAQIPALAATRRVITVDSRGHGKSSAGGAKLTLSQMAEDLIAVMDDAGIESADFLGFSDGGNIALILTVKHPERVRSLVVSGANSVPTGMKLSYFALLWLEHAFITLGTAFSKKCCRKKELLDLMLYEPDLRVWDLQKIRVPTLVTAGEHDMIRKSHTDYLSSVIENAEKHIFPGDHFSPQKLPEEYNKIVVNFFNSNNGKEAL